MDWKTLRRDKLAKTKDYTPTEPKEGAWWSGIDRLGDVWARFMTLSWWEKGMVIGTAVLLAVLAPMGIMALSGGNGGQAAALPPATGVQIVATAGPSPTITERPTSTPKAVPDTPTPTDTPGANREDCDAIRGTAYQSSDEQAWFLDNCDFAPEPTQPSGPGGPGPADTATPVPAAPTNTPVPQPSISAAQAASLAAGWIENNPTYSELQVTPASCVPQQSGDGWRVGCTGTTTGCVGACSITIWVCVSDASIRQC